MVPVQANSLSKKPKTRNYKGGGYPSALAALQAVQGWYDTWTDSLNEKSVQLCYSIIGANWVVHGAGTLSSCWAKYSVLSALCSLVASLFLTKVIGELLHRQYQAGEEDPDKWHDDFIMTRGKNDPWPSTIAIDTLSRCLRELRLWLPLIGGALFIISLFA
jgi:hypothetical protein